MFKIFNSINKFFGTLVKRSEKAQYEKAGRKWDNIVEELRNRK